MKLTKFFTCAAGAGLAFLTAGSAFAAFPQLPLAQDLLVEQGVPRQQAATIVKSLAGTHSVRVLSPASLDQIMTGIAEEITKARKKGDSETEARYTRMGLIVAAVDKTMQEKGTLLLPADRNGLNFLQKLNPEHAALAQAECYVYPAMFPDARSKISNSTGIPAEFIEKEIVSGKDLFLAGILHELAHCAADNVTAGNYKESRADLLSMNVMKNLSDNPDFVKNYMLLRILTPNFTTHNTGPFIDASLRDAAPPSYEQIETLYQDLMLRHNHKIAQLDMEPIAGKPRFLAFARVFNAVLDDSTIDLNPLTRRYMELYVEAAQTIAPKAAAEALVKTSPATNVMQRRLSP